MHSSYTTQPQPIMIQNHKRIITLIIASALFALLSSSCGSVRGIGSDISGVGRGIKNVAS